MKAILRASLIALAVGFARPAQANNIVVSGLVLTNIDTGARTLNAQFNVSWDNSWFLNPGSPPGNYDAAWLIIKYHVGDNVWRTASLDTNAANHVAPGGFTIKIARNGASATNGVGALLHRSSAGSGTANATAVKLRWLYGNDGVSNSALISAEIHAIEMVFVPSNAFKVGDSSSSSHFRTGVTTNPFLVSTLPITAGTNAGLLRVGAGNTNTSYTIPASFPAGLNDFYVMKYEASQGQYADFFNKTQPVGDLYAFSATTNFDRQGATNLSPDVVALTPDRARINLSYFDYLDFACLRPMTELEYEKICRGTSEPVAGEYAWGTAVAATTPYDLANDASATESVSANYNENAGNCWYPETQNTNAYGVGPCRVGMFAKASYGGTTSPRIQSGAGFYGVMDLTGNGNERVISVPSSPTSSSTNFTGVHGDGLVGTPPAGWSGGDTVYRGGSCTYRGVSGNVTGSIHAVSVQAPQLGGYGAIRGVRTLQ